jgi:inhibitor of KinA sporulation pathway (predicted exonuclease)
VTGLTSTGVRADPGESLVNVIDVEATCWPGAAPEGQVNEIIEIGLCVVDLASLSRVERHRILVRPVRSRVSEFCEALTGLTQEQVDGGVSFEEACGMLVADHHASARPWASWGDYDRKQFERQCRASDLPYPFAARHINAKAVFAEAYNRRPMGMARALDHAGLQLDGRHHCGADDAWNIAALVLHLVERGVWPDAPAQLHSA